MSPLKKTIQLNRRIQKKVLGNDELKLKIGNKSTKTEDSTWVLNNTQKVKVLGSRGYTKYNWRN